MIKKSILSLRLLVIFKKLSVAQTAEVTGSVISADDGQPVIGAACDGAFTPNTPNCVKT